MTSLTEKSIIKHNSKIISHNFGGTVYLIDSQGRTARILNRTASFIWKKTKTKISVGNLIRLLTEKFEVSADRAGRDIRQFIGSYLKQDLIILS